MCLRLQPVRLAHTGAWSLALGPLVAEVPQTQADLR